MRLWPELLIVIGVGLLVNGCSKWDGGGDSASWNISYRESDIQQITFGAVIATVGILARRADDRDR